MHKLNQKIRDIRDKLYDIFGNFSSIQNGTIQVALSSFAWILLDSYIAWRTLRFLLKDSDISDDINEKWYSTPSSYSFSQLAPIWRFDKNLNAIIKDKCNIDLKNICDIVQSQRNICAHYKSGFNVNIRGDDIETRIRIYLICFDIIFFIYEFNAMVNKLYLLYNVSHSLSTKIIINDKEEYEFETDIIKNKLFKSIFDILFKDLSSISIFKSEDKTIYSKLKIKFRIGEEEWCFSNYYNMNNAIKRNVKIDIDSGYYLESF